MPITQIPFQDPVAPPEKPQPEQLGLYDAQGWETAYRDLDDDAARVPHLLIQLQDDLARSRRREAAWISVIVHLILLIAIFNMERLEKYLPWHTAVVAKKPGAELSEAGVIAALKERLAAYKLPKRVIFVNDLPRNAMGKVQKALLRETYRDLYKP